MDNSKANKKFNEFRVSGQPQITKMSDDAGSRSAQQYYSLQVPNHLAQQSNKDPEQELAPKNPKTFLNNGRNPGIIQNIHSSLPTDPVHFMESIGGQNLGFPGDLHASQSGNRTSSSHSLTPSFKNDALSDRNEYDHKYDESTVELQHDPLARVQELNAKLQEELEDCRKKSGMLAKQLAAGGQIKWTEWRNEKQEQQHKDEIRKIKIDHALELNAQKEAHQKATKVEIDRAKLQLLQEFNSRIFQDFTNACKKRELCIKQYN